MKRCRAVVGVALFLLLGCGDVPDPEAALRTPRVAGSLDMSVQFAGADDATLRLTVPPELVPGRLGEEDKGSGMVFDVTSEGIRTRYDILTFMNFNAERGDTAAVNAAGGKLAFAMPGNVIHLVGMKLALKEGEFSINGRSFGEVADGDSVIIGDGPVFVAGDERGFWRLDGTR